MATVLRLVSEAWAADETEINGERLSKSVDTISNSINAISPAQRICLGRILKLSKRLKAETLIDKARPIVAIAGRDLPGRISDIHL